MLYAIYFALGFLAATVIYVAAVLKDIVDLHLYNLEDDDDADE